MIMGKIFALFLLSSFINSGPLISSVSLTGNDHIKSEYIFDATATNSGDFLRKKIIQNDITRIYNLGYFSYVDVDFERENEGLAVIFKVVENPEIKSIEITGNTLFPVERLKEEIYSSPGQIFNRNFFREDLDRMLELYHDEGYVMSRVSDVRIDEGHITIEILEPKIRNIIITGNDRTKNYEAWQKLKNLEGEIFNVDKFRALIEELERTGNFEDINIKFNTQEENEEVVDIVIDVEERGENFTGNETE